MSCGVGMRKNEKMAEGRQGAWLEGTHTVDREREPYLGILSLAPGCRMVFPLPANSVGGQGCICSVRGTLNQTHLWCI